MFKKISMGVALTLAIGMANASEYYIVVPLKGLAVAFDKNVAVTLQDYQLPAGKVNAPYAPFDLASLAQVTGDPRYSPDKLTWEVVTGALPAGLSVNAGVISGTPTTKNQNGNAFEVKASYRSKSAQKVYTIVVNGETLDVVAVSIAGGHACAITAGGGVKCWGRNDLGQLGNGTQVNSLTPVNVIGLSAGVTKISVGLVHTCAVTANGAAKCWGYNHSNRLGAKLGSEVYTQPQQVYGITSEAVDITARAGHSCALLSSGKVKCWGGNYDGQLGNGTSGAPGGYGPDEVANLTDAIKVEVGGNSTCALTNTGALKCWGIGSGYSSTTPAVIPGMDSGVISFGTGMNHTCAVTSAGAAKCWGWNYYGELGTADANQTQTPTQVVGLTSGVASLSMWDYSTCAVLTNGQLKCWGANFEGQLGIGSLTNSSTPATLTGLSDAKSVSVGEYSVCATNGSNEAYCWGRNNYGQLGTGNTTQQTSPQKLVAQP